MVLHEIFSKYIEHDQVNVLLYTRKELATYLNCEGGIVNTQK